MEFISETKTSEELLNSLNEEIPLELEEKPEEVNQKTPFDGSKDWHLQKITMQLIDLN